MTKSDRKIAVCSAIVASIAAGLAASPSAESAGTVGRQAELQRRLDRVVAAGVPGAVLLVGERDGTIRLTSGHARLKPKTPMRAGDRFRVGSITKTFVATVALQLIGENRLALEDTVERWLPSLVPDGGQITVRQLLNHTSGLFDYGSDREFVTQAVRDPLRAWTPREIIAIDEPPANEEPSSNVNGLPELTARVVN